MPIALGTLALYLLENNLLDSSGNGFTAVEVGSVPFVTVPAPTQGIYSAGTFGDADYLHTPAGFAALFDGSSNWTLSGRIYINSLAATRSGFSIYDGADYIGIQFGTTGDVRVFSSIGGLMLASSGPGVITASGWYYFAITYDGTDLKGYVFTLPGSSSTPVVTLAGASATVPVGSQVNMGILFPGAGLELDGYLDDVRFSNVTNTSFPTVDPSPVTGQSKLTLSPSIKL